MSMTGATPEPASNPDPAVAESEPEGDAARRAPIWQRHRGWAITVVVLVILAVTVITDLPTSTSRASDISAERSVMSELNSDLQPCAYGVHQALGIWALAATHRLSPADRAPTPGLLSDDQSACSFTNEGIFDLANIQVPGTPAGKELGRLVATATLWTTSDSLHVIEDVQTLMNSPGDAAAQRNLAKEEVLMAADRRAGLADEAAADHDLGTHLPAVDLPSASASIGDGTSSSGG
jgi:hypothetical protein